MDSTESDPYPSLDKARDDTAMAEAGGGINQDQELQEELRETARVLWKKRITRDRDFGLATLGYLYSGIELGWVLSVLCFLLLSAQLAIAVILAVNQVDEYVSDGLGFCPGNRFKASQSQKVLAFFIGVIYIVKLGFKTLREILCYNKDTDTTGTPLNMASKFPFQLFVCVDRFMDVVFEPLVYVLNLFVVSKATKELDMVLNTVALEFLLRLDNEFKTMILNTFAITDGIVDKARKAETRSEKDCDVHKGFVDLFALSLILVLLTCFLFTLVVTVWFIPCKFSLESTDV